MGERAHMEKHQDWLGGGGSEGEMSSRDFVVAFIRMNCQEREAGLGLISLNNNSRLWDVRAILSCLPMLE